MPKNQPQISVIKFSEKFKQTTSVAPMYLMIIFHRRTVSANNKLMEHDSLIIPTDLSSTDNWGIYHVGKLT